MDVHALLRAALGWLWTGASCVWISSTPLSASEPAASLLGPYVAERFEDDRGLPENSATAIVQTPDGFLWFGTYNGLVRYDGVRFEVFNRLNTPELPSAGIVNIHCDRTGALWCSTYEGLARYQNGRWQRFGEAEGWSANYARTFSDAPDGSLYLTAFDGSVWRFGGRGFDPLPNPGGTERESFGHCDPEGRFWIARRGFVGFLDSGQWQPVGPQPLARERQFGAGPARDGGFWILTGAVLRKLRGTQVAAERPLSEAPESFWNLRELSDGRILVASYRMGLYLIDPDGTVKCTDRIGPDQGGPDLSVRCVFEDREGNTWIGTSGSGLIRLTRRMFSSYTRAEGLTEPNVKSLALAPDGRVWIGTHGGGVFRVDRGRAEEVRLPDPALGPTLYVEALLADRSGQLWLSALGMSAPVFRVQGDRAVRALEGSPSMGGYRAMLEDSQGRVWVGGDAALLCFHGNGIASFPIRGVRALAEDPEDRTLWAANEQGLFRYASGAFEEKLDHEGHPHGDVLCIRPTRGRTVWLGTAGRGLVCRRADGATIPIGPDQGLPVEDVGAMIDDDVGSTWLASSRGVVRVQRSRLEAAADGLSGRISARLYTRAEGLPSTQLTTGRQPVAVKTKDGRLWFATPRGVAVVDPANVVCNRVPPPVVITSATYRDRHRLRHAFPLTAGQPVEIPAGSADIKVDFAILSFVAPEKVQWRSRLERKGTLLSERFGSVRFLAFELVPAGDYTLRLTAANNDGVWNEEGATLQFRVLPFFWEQTGFRVAAGLGFLGLAWGSAAYLVRHHRLRYRVALAERERAAAEVSARAGENLRASEARRIRAEDEAELRRQREALARDVHDGLGGLAANLSMMAAQTRHLTDPRAMSAHLAAIESLAREQLNEVRSLMNTLETVHHDCGTLAAQFRRYGRLVLEPRGIALEVDCRGPDHCACANSTHFIVLFRIYKEAIANAARHSGARTVRVNLKCALGRVRLVIEDDGVGLPAEPRLGRGLRNMERRTAELGGHMVREGPPGLRLTFEMPWPARITDAAPCAHASPPPREAP